MSEFRDFLEKAARRFRTKAEFAKAMGITPGRLSRVLGGEHSLDVANCLRLAKLTGDAPSHVLRVAGKGEVADLIESFYGPGAPSLSPADRDLLDTWHALHQRQRGLLEGLIDDMRSSSSKPALRREETSPRARESSSRRSPAAAHHKRGVAQ